jgi:SAM-dependent methyltransferase
MTETARGVDDRRNVRFFSELVARHGVAPQALNWGSAASQQMRFQVLVEAGLEDGDSVLDVGCGQGDLYGWLLAKGWRGCYRGIDITPRMVDISRERFPEVAIQLGDVFRDDLAPADRIVASGIFYFRQDTPFEYMQAVLLRMFALCRKSVAVNSLSGWAPQEESHEFHADPLKTLAFCRTLTPWVVLRHDYHPRDFTVYLYKRTSA